MAVAWWLMVFNGIAGLVQSTDYPTTNESMKLQLSALLPAQSLGPTRRASLPPNNRQTQHYL